MKLAAVLDKHSEFSVSGQLNDSLGDGFLLQHNTLYRQIRHRVLDLGFTFSTEMSADDLAFPMGQLENILARKVIPYFNNVEPLKRLNSRASLNLMWDHVVDNLKANYVFHESCHGVARSLGQKVKGDDLQTKIVKILIEESFANSCEFFAMAEAHDLFHRTFLEVNSYFTVFEDRTNLKKCLERMEPKFVFKMMLLCYLHSHFLNEDLNDQSFKRILLMSNLNQASEIKSLKSLAKNVFVLNPRFRYTTNEMYLRLSGIQQPVASVLNFDYLQKISQDKDLSRFIDELSQITSS